MHVICPECDREFFIPTDVWENIVSDVSTHQRRTCPNCGEGMCFTCEFVPAAIYTAQGVRRTVIPRPIRDRNRRPSRDRRSLIRKPDYPF